jgi:hypothetical protein
MTQATDLQPAARIANIGDAELNALVSGERNARRQSQIDFLRGINNLVKSFSQRTEREALVLQ